MKKISRLAKNSRMPKRAGEGFGRVKGLVALFAVAVVAAIIFFLVQAKAPLVGKNAGSTDKINLKPYTYKNIQSGAGLSFQKPDQFVLSGANGNLIKTFVWTSGDHKVGTIYVFSAPFTDNSQRQSVLSSAKDFSQNTTSQDYQTADQPVTLLARGWLASLNSKYITQLGTASRFRQTEFPTDTAWEFPLGASGLKGSNLPVMKGSFLFLVSNKAAYYFGVATTSQKWQQDSATWQQILNSIRIDQ